MGHLEIEMVVEQTAAENARRRTSTRACSRIASCSSAARSTTISRIWSSRNCSFWKRKTLALLPIDTYLGHLGGSVTWLGHGVRCHALHQA